MTEQLQPDSSPLTAVTPPPLPAEPSPPWNAWWTLLWAALIFLAWQLLVSVGLVIALFLSGAEISELITDGDVNGLVSFIALFFICPACWFIGQICTGWSGWDYLGQKKVRWWHWPLWSVATIACSLIFTLLSPYLGIDGPDDSMVAMGKSTQYPILLFLGVAIAAPLIEEFMFRGVLWRGWRASRLGFFGTLFLTSFLWAILHVQYPPVIISYIFFLGLLMGLAREKTGNLWIPVWMHTLNNSLATLSMLSL